MSLTVTRTGQACGAVIEGVDLSREVSPEVISSMASQLFDSLGPEAEADR